MGNRGLFIQIDSPWGMKKKNKNKKTHTGHGTWPPTKNSPCLRASIRFFNNTISPNFYLFPHICHTKKKKKKTFTSVSHTYFD